VVGDGKLLLVSQIMGMVSVFLTCQMFCLIFENGVLMGMVGISRDNADCFFFNQGDFVYVFV
jgi:hypothetical protein